MVSKQFLFLTLIISLAFNSCTTTEKPAKPSATGKAGEMIVVIDKTRWDGHSGDLLRAVFAAPLPMLNQREPQFDVMHLEPKAFVKLFETHRNLLIVEFDESLERGKIEATRDVWSYPQMVVKLIVPNEKALERILQQNTESLIERFLATERERLTNAFSRMINNHARTTVRNTLGLDVMVPEGYFVAKSEDNFIWLRQTGTREDLDLGLLITVLPYRDASKDFNPDYIWQRRDSITRLHIPGTMPGSYMRTYPELRPQFREITFNGRFAIEARALWRLEGDFMGGPFVNITFVDETTSRLINLDGFVYAPKFDKRNYIRQLEALMYSVKPYKPNTED